MSGYLVRNVFICMPEARVLYYRFKTQNYLLLGAVLRLVLILRLREFRVQFSNRRSPILTAAFIWFSSVVQTWGQYLETWTNRPFSRPSCHLYNLTDEKASLTEQGNEQPLRGRDSYDVCYVINFLLSCKNTLFILNTSFFLILNKAFTPRVAA